MRIKENINVVEERIKMEDELKADDEKIKEEEEESIK